MVDSPIAIGLDVIDESGIALGPDAGGHPAPSLDIAGPLHQVGIGVRCLPVTLGPGANPTVWWLVDIESTVGLPVTGPDEVATVRNPVVEGLGVRHLVQIRHGIVTRIGVHRSIRPTAVDVPLADKVTGVDIDDELDHPGRIGAASIRVAAELDLHILRIRDRTVLTVMVSRCGLEIEDHVMIMSELAETVQVAGVAGEVGLIGANVSDRLTVQVGPKEVKAVPQLVGP